MSNGRRTLNASRGVPIYVMGMPMREKSIILALLLAATGICVAVPWLMAAGKLKTPISLVAFWSLGVVLVGVCSAAFIIVWSKRLRRSVRAFESAFAAARGAVKAKSNQPVIPEGRQEIFLIRQEEPDEEIRQVLCRMGFRQLLSLWDQANLVATFHGLQSVWDLGRRWGLRREFLVPIEDLFFGESALDRSLIKRRFYVFPDGSGCWYAASGDRDHTSLEAAYAALRLAQVMLNYRVKKQFTRDDLASFLAENPQDGTDRIDRLERYLRNCFDVDTGGFRGHPDQHHPDIANTGLAVRISNILYCGGHGEDDGSLGEAIIEHFGAKQGAGPCDYIMRCRRKVMLDDGRTAMAFSRDLVQESPVWMCVTFFAASSLMYLGKIDSLRQKENSDALAVFIEACCRAREEEKPGPTTGFVARPEYEYEDIMHTFYALKLAEMVCPSYLSAKGAPFLESVGRFVGSCKATAGGTTGYRFRPAPKFAPHVFATCLARNIATFLQDRHVDITGFFDPIESLTFYARCYNGAAAGFHGYPLTQDTK